MRSAKSAGPSFMSVVLALRLNQIEASFESYDAFAAKAAVSRGTLYQLRSGRGNATLKTIQTLAKNLGLTESELFGVPPSRMAEGLMSYGLMHDEVVEFVGASEKAFRPIGSFTGVQGSAKPGDGAS